MPTTAPITDLGGERFSRLLAARDAAQAKVADLDRRIAQECRRYSDANGYRVLLRPEQVTRHMESVK